MTWTHITSPADLPPEFDVVLVSSGDAVGLAFYRQKDIEHIKRMNSRPDGWTMIWPVDHDVRFGKIIKYSKLPLP